MVEARFSAPNRRRRYSHLVASPLKCLGLNRAKFERAWLSLHAAANQRQFLGRFDHAQL